MASVDGAVIGGVGLATTLAIILGVIGFTGIGYYTWFNAPPVGGEWWFYIRIIVTLLAAVIAAKIFALIGQIVGFILGTIIGGIVG